MITKITQSFIKDMRAYLAPGSDVCGHEIRYKWIEGKLLEGSKLMKLGAYFEYCLTGALPKDGKIPVPERTQKGELTAPYQRAYDNAQRIKKYLSDMGLKILNAGKKLTRGRYQGTVDIIAVATKELVFEDHTLKVGDEIIIDVKYSDLLDDRWSHHGWMWTEDQRKYHGTQAIQYHFVGRRPFYFLVCCSSNTIDIKFFRVEISKKAIDQHIKEGNDLFGELELINLDDKFIPRPSVSKCAECQIRSGCKDRHDFPHPISVAV